MSPDSMSQYIEAKEGLYSDHHPLIMAWVWNKLNYLYEGPAIMLALNLGLYWAGWALFSISLESAISRIAIFLPIAGLWPPVLLPSAQIWKDIAFSNSLFCAFSVVVLCYCQKRCLSIIELIFIFGLTVYATGVKPNGILAVICLFCFTGFIQSHLRWKNRSIIVWTIFLTLSTVLSIQAIGSATNYVKMYSVQQYIQIHDTVGISVLTRKNLLPNYLRQKNEELNSVKSLQRIYSPANNNYIYFTLEKGVWTSSRQSLQELHESWLTAIRSYPMKYLEHRLNVSLELLRWGNDFPAYTVVPEIVPNKYGLKYNKNIFALYLYSSVEKLGVSYYPWIYLVLGALLAIGLYVLLPAFRIPLAFLNIASFSFVWPHFFIAPANDYRYLYFSILIAVFLISSAILAFVKSLGIRCCKKRVQ
jgi:hypothetical protein